MKYLLIAIIIIIIILLLCYMNRGEGFENREEKQKELFGWFQKNGPNKSYNNFKNKFYNKKADIVDFEKGRRGALDGTLKPETF